MSHLTKFNTEATYNANKGSLVLPNVSLISNTDEVKFAPKSVHFLDYLHSDGSINSTPSNDVVGICVIPASHYGKARFVSLVNMSTSSTSGTTSDTGIVWRSSGSTTDLDKQYTIPGYGVSGSTVASGSVSVSDLDGNIWGQLPTDRLHGGYEDEHASEINLSANGWDPIAKYWYDEYEGGLESDYNCIMSPFLANGSLNPFYHNLKTGSLSDINGEANTAALLAKSSTNYPTALACKNFAPGLANGSWYLPAMGELAYLQVRWGAINDKLTALANAGCSVAYLPANDVLWSSSEYNSGSAWGLDTDYGGFNCYDAKDYGKLVRAFLAL